MPINPLTGAKFDPKLDELNKHNPAHHLYGSSAVNSVISHKEVLVQHSFSELPEKFSNPWCRKMSINAFFADIRQR